MALKEYLKSTVLADSARYVYLTGKKYLAQFNLQNRRDFVAIAQQLESSQWWSTDQMARYQWDNIVSLISHAHKTVPYYQKIFAREGIQPQDIKTIADFNQLPFLTREAIKHNGDDLISRSYPKNKLIKKFTGGTTGAPVDFYEEKLTQVREEAFSWRFWNWFGYKIGDRCAILRGNNLNKRPFYDPYRNYLVFPINDLHEKAISPIVDELCKFKPPYIQAYPSIAYLIARYINQTNINNKIDFIKVVFCASEQLFNFQRKEIHQAFNGKVVEHYGHNEKAVLMLQCEHSENLHIIPEYGYTEIIDDTGAAITQPGQIGEIVGTGFNNYAFPFIRYRTGDYAMLASSICTCNRIFREVREIQGRSGDYLTTPSGKKISSTVIEFAFDLIRRVREWQIIQHQRDCIEIIMVPEAGYNKNSEKVIVTGLENIIKEKLEVKFIYADHLPKPPSLKYRLVVSSDKLT